MGKFKKKRKPLADGSNIKKTITKNYNQPDNNLTFKSKSAKQSKIKPESTFINTKNLEIKPESTFINTKNLEKKPEPEPTEPSESNIIDYGDYIKRENVDFDAIVIVASHNRFKKINNLLKQLYTQPTTYKFKVIMVNDGSTDVKYDSIKTKYPEIIYLKNKVCGGKIKYWETINTLLKVAKNFTAHMIIQLDDDFILCDDFIDEAVNNFFKMKDLGDEYMALNIHEYTFSNKPNIDYDWDNNDVNIIDGGTVYDTRFMEAINYKLDGIEHRVRSYTPSFVWVRMTEYINSLNMKTKNLNYSLVFHDGNYDSKLNPVVRKEMRMETKKFKLTNQTDKKFSNDFNMIYNKVINKDNFAFSKYADGEYAILRNQYIKNCDGWIFDPEKHIKEYNELMSSFTFNEDGYYVGISCPCCVPFDHVDWMRNTVKVDDKHLTWANIFVNSNYELFKSKMIEAFKNETRDIILVANKLSKVNNLPFDINEFIGVSDTAWVDNFDLIDELSNRNDENKLYLFCAGPLGNMLAAKMWRNNKNNTYMDIGSTLNGYLTEKNRGYLIGSPTSNKTCIW